MSRKQREIHNNYCNYMVDKARSDRVTMSNNKKLIGITFSNLTKEKLIIALAM